MANTLIESDNRVADAPTLIDRSLFAHVPVVVEAILGRSEITIGELEQLKPGAQIELDATLDRAVELRVNGRTIAHGEIVSVGDRFGVRITEIGG